MHLPCSYQYNSLLLLNLSVELAGELIFVAVASDCCENIYGGRGLLDLRDLSVSVGLVSRGRKKRRQKGKRQMV